MTLANVRAWCLDAADVRRAGAFWAQVFAAPLELGDDGDAVIRSAGLLPLWIDPVPEPKLVKNRVHLDLRAPSTDALVALGAEVVDDQGGFRVLRDPEGNELCLFPGDSPAGAATPFAVCVDSARPEELASWWAAVLGGELQPGPDGALRWLVGAAGLGDLTMKFVRVGDARVAKNRMHWDVETDNVDALVGRGATVLRSPDDEIGWTVLSDVDGNEFCAFDR